MKRLFLPTLLLVVILSACLPIQRFATGTLNDQLGDSAVLSFVFTPEGGLLFDPGDSSTIDTIVDILFDSLNVYDEALCIPSGNGLLCDLGTVDEAVFIRVSASNVTAEASYRRPDGGRLYTEFAIR